MDAGRKFDLEELYKARENAKSVFERDKYDKMIYDICQEKGVTVSLREQLIRAVKAGDKYHTDKISQIINRNKHLELNGRQF